MRDWIRRRFTKTVYVQKGPGKKLERVEVPPSERFVYLMLFSIAALIIFAVIEALHIIFLRSFNESIFNAINGLVGTITGLIIGKKV
ncbi:MAG: hypothetical protein NWE81_01255 [Candidatus Bathyarchaeota archaeon]|nr:hypothetical protein [Candidatus Bathyarchaeota archaeon]